MKKVISLLELQVENVCNKCQNKYSRMNCNCARLDPENLNYDNKDDCYSIYSNFYEIKYKQAQNQPKLTTSQDKENIISLYNKAESLDTNSNKTIAVSYNNIMTQYNQVKSKRYR